MEGRVGGVRGSLWALNCPLASCCHPNAFWHVHILSAKKGKERVHAKSIELKDKLHQRKYCKHFIVAAPGSTSCTFIQLVGRLSARWMEWSCSLSWMRRRPVDAQSKAAAAAQRQLDRSTAATASNTSPPLRSAGDFSAEQGFTGHRETPGEGKGVALDALGFFIAQILGKLSNALNAVRFT